MTVIAILGEKVFLRSLYNNERIDSGNETKMVLNYFSNVFHK